MPETEPEVLPRPALPEDHSNQTPPRGKGRERDENSHLSGSFCLLNEGPQMPSQTILKKTEADSDSSLNLTKAIEAIHEVLPSPLWLCGFVRRQITQQYRRHPVARS